MRLYFGDSVSAPNKLAALGPLADRVCRQWNPEDAFQARLVSGQVWHEEFSLG